jgi:hypothetical protein
MHAHIDKSPRLKLTDKSATYDITNSPSHPIYIPRTHPLRRGPLPYIAVLVVHGIHAIAQTQGDDVVGAHHDARESAVAAGAPECGAQSRVLVCEVEDVLRERGALDDGADLDGAFFFDELADRV